MAEEKTKISRPSFWTSAVTTPTVRFPTVEISTLRLTTVGITTLRLPALRLPRLSKGSLPRPGIRSVTGSMGEGAKGFGQIHARL